MPLVAVGTNEYFLPSFVVITAGLLSVVSYAELTDASVVSLTSSAIVLPASST